MYAYKFPLYPDREQQEKLWHHSWLMNRLYNRFIDLEQKTYEETKKHLNAYALCYLLPKIKSEEPEYKEISAQSLQRIPIRIDNGYKMFFKYPGVVQPPSFRSCRFFYNIEYPQVGCGYKIIDDKFVTKQYGTIEFFRYREVKGNVKTVTVTNDHGKFYLVIVTDYVYKSDQPYYNAHVGIDLGLMNLVTTSDGITYRGCWSEIKYYDKQIDKLKSLRDTKYPLKKGEDGKKHPSRNRKHLNKVITRLYGAKRHKVLDTTHKITHDLSSKFDTVAVEDLRVKEMSETAKTGMNRAIRNVCFGKVLEQLSYKCKRVIRVSPTDTSKTCCKCGHTLKESLPLSTRTWTCPECGTKLDRDRNAALNVLHLGRAVSSMMYVGKKLTIHDIDPFMWMDRNLYVANELALVARPCSQPHEEAPSFRGE